MRDARRLGIAVLGLVCGLAVTTGCSRGAPPASTTPAADAGSYPFFVQIHNAVLDVPCGGVLVAQAWVLTAAYCVGGADPSGLRVLIGRTRPDDGSQGESRGVSMVKAHPSAKAASTSFDVALVRLDSPSTARPIPLAGTGEYPPGTILRTVGFTTTSGRADRLRQVDLTVLADDDPAIGQRRPADGFQADVMAGARITPGGRTSCAGDRGGPVVLAVPGGFRLVGIAGRERGCLTSDGLVLFADVAAGPVRGWLQAQVPASLAAFVLANQPATADYTPATTGNSAGGQNQVTRADVGSYRVSFGGLGAGADDGIGHVTGYGSACRITGWRASGPDLAMDVRCTGGGGVAEDARFTASFTRPGGEAPYAHVLVDDADKIAISYNSADAQNTVSRDAPGEYTVTLPGVGVARGTAKVSSYGGANSRCALAGWTAGGDPAGAPASVAVRVRCFTGGAPADSPFGLSYSGGPALSPLQSGGWAWLRTDQPDGSFNSVARSNTLSRLRQGTYQVQLAGMGSARGGVHVTAIATKALLCTVDDQAPVGDGIQVTVVCTTPAGVPTDTDFALQFQI